MAPGDTQAASAEETLEAGTASPARPKGSPLRCSQTDEAKDSDSHDGDERMGHPKHPPHHLPALSMLSSVVSAIEDRLHRMPKWQYRLLVGCVFFLLGSLVLMTVISVVYGFGMTFPHISITAINPRLPFPYMDGKGAIPIDAAISFTNPNSFKAEMRPTTIEIYALPSRSQASLLAVAHAPELHLQAQEQQDLTSEFVIEGIGKAAGGPEIVQAVAGGKSTLMYTSSDTRIIVKSLGFLPISRMYHAECTILKEWSPGGRVLSDCWGRFV